MPRLLLVVEGSRWDFADDLAAWESRCDLPAAPLGDLRPSATNKLSVWVIDDDHRNLDRVIAGYAAARANIDRFEARLVDAAAVERSASHSSWRPANRETSRRTRPGIGIWWT